MLPVESGYRKCVPERVPTRFHDSNLLPVHRHLLPVEKEQMDYMHFPLCT